LYIETVIDVVLRLWHAPTHQACASRFGLASNNNGGGGLLKRRRHKSDGTVTTAKPLPMPRADFVS
jgi:hypothetical protein